MRAMSGGRIGRPTATAGGRPGIPARRAGAEVFGVQTGWYTALIHDLRRFIAAGHRARCG